MGGKTSRDKGARFERWVATELRERGWKAERKRQSAAYDSDADVIASKMVEDGRNYYERSLAVECKNRKTMPSKALLDAWTQATEGARQDDLPIVVTKLPGTTKALVILDFHAFLSLFT